MMVKLFYFEVKDNQEGDMIADHLHLLNGLSFVTQSAVPGTLTEVIELIKETNAFDHMTTRHYK